MTRTPNAILHPWFEAELSAIVATQPRRGGAGEAAANRAAWSRWQEGLSVRFTLLDDLPPLRMLLILDNLAGHKSAAFVCWLMAHGIMPLYTALGGQLVEHGRVDAADFDEPRAVGTTPRESRTNHGPVRSRGARLE